MIYSPNKILHGNFKYYEVFKSSTADRLEINNVPEGKELDKILEAAEQTCIHIAQPVRDEFGSYSPNSWFRCERLEKVICDVSFKRWMINNKRGIGDNSLTESPSDAWPDYFKLKSHPEGESIDYEISGISNSIVFEWCKENLPQFDQLIAEFMKVDDYSAGWIHGSYSLDHNRMQIKEIK